MILRTKGVEKKKKKRRRRMMIRSWRKREKLKKIKLTGRFKAKAADKRPRAFDAANRLKPKENKVNKAVGQNGSSVHHT